MEDQDRTSEHGAGPGELQCLWIENEGLLRDEGVVFGLTRTPSALTEKEAAIRAFHRRHVAEDARRRQAVEAELVALLQRHERETDAARLAQADAAPEPEGDAPGGLVARDAVGLAAAAAACAGTAVFVHEQLQPHFQNPALVAAGVVGAGFCAAFLPASARGGAHASGGAERWTARLAELVLPLAAALFVVAWGLDGMGPVRAAATAALLFLAFALTGRQVMGTVPRLGSAVRALRRERATRLARSRERAAELERAALDGAVAALRRELAALRSAEEWEAICDTRVAIFRSEYELAAARAGSGTPHLLPPNTHFSSSESH